MVNIHNLISPRQKTTTAYIDSQKMFIYTMVSSTDKLAERGPMLHMAETSPLALFTSFEYKHFPATNWLPAIENVCIGFLILTIALDGPFWNPK